MKRLVVYTITCHYVSLFFAVWLMVLVCDLRWSAIKLHEALYTRACSPKALKTWFAVRNVWRRIRPLSRRNANNRSYPHEKNVAFGDSNAKNELDESACAAYRSSWFVTRLKIITAACLPDSFTLNSLWRPRKNNNVRYHESERIARLILDFTWLM